MDYLTVTQAAFLSAFATTACLLGLLLFQSFQHKWKRFLLVGVIGQFIWALTLFISYNSAQPNTSAILGVEFLRLMLWLICLGLLLSKRTSILAWPLKAKILAIVTTAIAAYGGYSSYFLESSADSISLTLMLLATSSLVFTEQVVRNLNTHRMVKLIGLCLTFLFAFDVLMYGHNLISETIPTAMWQARAALAFMVAATLSVGTLIFNERGDSQYIFTVSRPAAFFSTAVLFSILLIGAVSLGSFYVKQQGFLGAYLFTLVMLGALLLLFTLVISKAFRQHFEVFISKHFFALKYDYRIEWLQAIKRLSDLRTIQENYYEDILNILCAAVRAESGSLWISNGSELKEITSNLELPNTPEAITINEPFIRTMLKESWIYVPQSRSTSLAENNRLLPNWIEANENIWLIAPLIIQMKLVGFVILTRPRIDSEITFEDRDLMTNISTQVASHILLHQQEKVISDAKQLETYNRLSAFIMHDINNVIAQLALIGKNAERHRKNPAFVDDMIKTVHNATSRMQGLVQKFNPASKEQRSSFAASELLADLYSECEGHLPKPELSVEHDFQVGADKQRLTLALKNLVRNAQEATSDDGSVKITARLENGTGHIIIEDDGLGMSQSFINEELFRPFATTKIENGVGIGAYLTKSYIEHLGAILSVQSKKGTGTRFEITFG